MFFETRLHMSLRLLILSSLPDDSGGYRFDKLPMDRKARALKQAISDSPYGDFVEAHHIGAVVASRLAHILAEHRPDILHIIVHGQRDILAFEGGDGTLVQVHATQLAQIVADTASIRLVCLEVCHSRSIAEALARAGAPGRRPFAIGMHFELPSGTGDRFFATMYQGLFATGRVDLGFAQARRALELGDDRGYVLPALICPEGQAADVPLFTPWPLRSLAAGATRVELDLRGAHARPPAELVDRAEAVQQLGECWADPKIGVVHLHGPTGCGKTSMVGAWLARLRDDGWRDATRVVTWSLASDGDVRQLFAALDPGTGAARMTCSERDGLRLAVRLRGERVLLVIDDVVALPRAAGGREEGLARALHPALAGLLRGLADGSPGLCVVVTRAPAGVNARGAVSLALGPLAPAAACELLWRRGLIAEPPLLAAIARALDGHAGALALITGPAYENDETVAALHRRLQAHGEGTPLLRAWRSLAPLSDAARAVLWTIAERGGEVRPVADSEPALRELARAGLLCMDIGLRGHVAQPAIVALALQEIEATASTVTETKRDEADSYEALRGVLEEMRRIGLRGDWPRVARRYIDEVCCYEPTKYQWSKIARTFQAVPEDLELLAQFFVSRWTTLRPALLVGPAALPLREQGYLLHRTALALRQLGRIDEALAPMQAAEAVFVAAGCIDRAVTCGNDGAELLVLLDRVPEALHVISRALALAAPLDQPREMHLVLATYGHLLDLAGRGGEAAEAFAAATVQVGRLNREMGLHTARDQQLASLPGLYHFEHQLRIIAELAAQGQETGAAVTRLTTQMADGAAFHRHHNTAPSSQAFAMLGFGRLAALCARERSVEFPAAEVWQIVPDVSSLAQGVAVGSDDPRARTLGVYAELFFSRAVTTLRDTHHRWLLPTTLLLRVAVRSELLGDRINARLDLEEALEIAGDDMPWVRREATELRTRLGL